MQDRCGMEGGDACRRGLSRQPLSPRPRRAGNYNVTHAYVDHVGKSELTLGAIPA